MNNIHLMVKLTIKAIKINPLEVDAVVLTILNTTLVPVLLTGAEVVGTY
jgi:hypothetical protein